MTGSRWLAVLRWIPYADGRDRTAGFAMGLVAALAAAAWYVSALGIRALGGVGPLSTGLTDVALAGSVLVAPVAVPAAVVCGTLLWRRFAPATPDPRRGAVLGAATAIGSLVVGSLGVGVLLVVFAILDALEGNGGGANSFLVEWVVVTGLVLVFALLFVGWLVVPVGALGGWYHERELQREPSEAAIARSVE